MFTFVSEKVLANTGLFRLKNCLVILFSLSGCGVTDKAAKIINDDLKTDEKEYAEQVFEYLKNEDIDSLCELFAPDVCAELPDTESLDMERKKYQEQFGAVLGRLVEE